MNVVDLFAGVGGFGLGAHLAGFSVPLVIDLDKDLTFSGPANFPGATILNADLASIDPVDALRKAKLKPQDVCGLVGGPPCQGFSYIGARDPQDPRNRLIFEYFRFARAVRPAFFVLENVPGILTEPFRAVLDRAIENLHEEYTIVGPVCIDAASFGAATRRRRILLIGYRTDRVGALNKADIRAVQDEERATVYEAIHDLPSPQDAFMDGDGEYYGRYTRSPDKGKKGNYARQAREAPPDGLGSEAVRRAFKAGMITGFKPTVHTDSVRRRFSRLSEGEVDAVSKCPRLAWDETCPTLRAGTGPDRGSFQSIRPIHPREHRVITVREAARLQGFPDWFRFHPTQWHSFRMIGNSVSPFVARAILKLLRDRIQG